MGTGPLSCMASLSAQLAMWEGAGPEAGRAAWGPPGRRPQSAVSSGVSAQRGLSLGGRWRPRRHGPVPGVWEEGLEPERVSLRRAALLRPLLTSRVGLWVRVTGAVLPPGPGSGRPPGPLRRLSLRAQPPWLLDPCSRDLRTLTSSSVIGSRFSLAQKRLPRALLSPPGGCLCVPAPGAGSQQHSCVPRGRGDTAPAVRSCCGPSGGRAGARGPGVHGTDLRGRRAATASCVCSCLRRGPGPSAEALGRTWGRRPWERRVAGDIDPPRVAWAGGVRSSGPVPQLCGAEIVAPLCG